MGGKQLKVAGAYNLGVLTMDGKKKAQQQSREAHAATPNVTIRLRYCLLRLANDG